MESAEDFAVQTDPRSKMENVATIKDDDEGEDEDGMIDEGGRRITRAQTISKQPSQCKTSQVRSSPPAELGRGYFANVFLAAEAANCRLCAGFQQCF